MITFAAHAPSAPDEASKKISTALQRGDYDVCLSASDGKNKSLTEGRFVLLRQKTRAAQDKPFSGEYTVTIQSRKEELAQKGKL